ncbi:hypothetical protein AB6C69_23055, partial [Vibrio splendidus]
KDHTQRRTREIMRGSVSAMVSVTSKENYGYEFIQAVPKAQLSDGTSHMTYDESGLYLSEALVNALINCKPVTVMHRQLSL